MRLECILRGRDGGRLDGAREGARWMDGIARVVTDVTTFAGGSIFKRNHR